MITANELNERRRNGAIVKECERILESYEQEMIKASDRGVNYFRFNVKEVGHFLPGSYATLAQVFTEILRDAGYTNINYVSSTGNLSFCW